MSNKFAVIFIVGTTITLSACSRTTSNVQIASPTNNAIVQEATPAYQEELNELKVGKADNAFQKPFTIKYPTGWIVSTSDYNSDPKYFLQLEKEDHKLQIDNLPKGGGSCLYAGDPDYNGPHADYRNLVYQEDTLPFGTVRTIRKPTLYDKNRDQITYCMKNKEGRYQTITTIGVISMDIPRQSNDGLIKEMQQMLKTVTITE